MPRKPKPDNPEQFKRFIDMAREVGAEQPSPNFERVFRKVAEKPKRPTPKATAAHHRVDGRVHNRLESCLEGKDWLGRLLL